MLFFFFCEALLSRWLIQSIYDRLFRSFRKAARYNDNKVVSGLRSGCYEYNIVIELGIVVLLKSFFRHTKIAVNSGRVFTKVKAPTATPLVQISATSLVDSWGRSAWGVQTELLFFRTLFQTSERKFKSVWSFRNTIQFFSFRLFRTNLLVFTTATAARGIRWLEWGSLRELSLSRSHHGMLGPASSVFHLFFSPACLAIAFTPLLFCLRDICFSQILTVFLHYSCLSICFCFSFGYLKNLFLRIRCDQNVCARKTLIWSYSYQHPKPSKNPEKRCEKP